MNLLLDTQVLLWWREAAASSDRAHAQRSNYTLRDQLHLWMPAAIETSGFVTLHITIDHAVGVASLPDHHADPFDRLLIVQARLENMTIVTSDAASNEYDVRVLDART